MKKSGLFALIIFVAAFTPALSQNKKLDKSLKKIDGYYASGNFLKALSGLKKFKSGAEKMGPQSNYMVEYYLREAKFNLAAGVLSSFDLSITNALNASKNAFTEDSKMYASTLLDAADLYNQYGNFRLSREYVDKSKKIMEKVGAADDIKARSTLIEAEALIGQGFCNKAIELIESVETYYAGRAVEKETTVEDGNIKTKRLPEEELYRRFNEYAKLKILHAYATVRKGVISVIGANAENPDSETLFNNLEAWLKGKSRYLGATSLVEIEYRYLWGKSLHDNGTASDVIPSKIQFDNTLNALKRKVIPTNNLAHDLYLSYLDVLLKNDDRGRYQNLKLEYDKVIDKNYPKTSVHKINMRAVEFNAKISREKTKDLESEALTVLATKSLPKNYKTNLLILDFLYDIAVLEKRFTNAEGYLSQIMEMKKELCGENSVEYHLARLALANFYIDYTNKIEEAGKIYDESYFKIVSKEIGEQHSYLVPILNHIAAWYEYTDKYSLAQQTLKDAGQKAESKFNNEDILLGIELNHIANLQLKIGDYDAAEKNITRALQIIRLKESKGYLEQKAAHIAALETQARLYGIKGLFDEATENLDRTRKLIRDLDSKANNDLSSNLELSGLLIQLGRYSTTEKLLDEIIPEYEKLYGVSSLRLVEPLVHKGRILLANGEYPEAEKVALRANQLAVKAYGETSTKTAPTQRLLSDVYYTFGDYDKAQSNINKAIASQEKQFGRSHIEVAKSLSQLALIRFYKGDNKQQVEKLMLESRDIMAAKLTKDNPQYAEILKNVAILYISEKKYDIAFNSLTQAETIWRTKTGTKNNVNAASIYTLTGDVYYQLKNYKKAEEFYNQAIKLYKTFFSDKHPEYVKVLSKLAKVHYMRKEYKDSKKLIEEALNNYEGFIKDFFPALSERQKQEYWKSIRGDFEFYNTLAFSNLEDFKDLTRKVYDYQLLTKALLLSSSIKIRERILSSPDEELKNQFNSWVLKKEQLTLALSMSPTQLQENGIDPGALQQEVERLEKTLSEQSDLFKSDFENKRITYEDVRKSLKPNEVALEMVRYRYFNHTLTDSVIYAALYGRSDLSRPKAILLNDGKKMETKFFKFYRNAITGRIPDPYSYGVFWEPIQKEIGTASNLYFSPDGIYNQLNVESIPTPDGKYVIDNANIILVNNTKDIYLRKIKTRTEAKENNVVMFGNPAFYLTASADQTIPPLPGTEQEVEQSKFMINQKGGMSASEYIEKSATEEKIKGLVSPRILHLATHGFYKPSDESNDGELEEHQAALTQNPLMRAGLLLTGAGDILSKTDYNYNIDDGILTAEEAMSLNLDGTDLVLLSACETGLGELRSGEGVYGLQRSFLQAGAKLLIMSMFKVDDDATRKLIVKFYQKWLNTKNYRQSFTEARKELRDEYPDPIFWGAIMIIGLE